MRFLWPGVPEELLHLRAGLKMPSLNEVSAMAAQGEAVCDALRRQVEKLGLSIGDEPVWAEASFTEETDPFSREVSLVALWRGKARFGKATFFPDGRIFAEYQVLLPHPEKDDHYVDSVQIWCRPRPEGYGTLGSSALGVQEFRGEPVIVEYFK